MIDEWINDDGLCETERRWKRTKEKRGEKKEER